MTLTKASSSLLSLCFVVIVTVPIGSSLSGTYKGNAEQMRDWSSWASSSADSSSPFSCTLIDVAPKSSCKSGRMASDMASTISSSSVTSEGMEAVIFWQISSVSFSRARCIRFLFRERLLKMANKPTTRNNPASTNNIITLSCADSFSREA